MSTESLSSISLVVEQRRLSLNEVFVYKVPPLRTASGHRAEEWGLADPLFTGHLRVFQADTVLRIVLFAYRDPTSLMTADENLVLFGECPIEVKPAEDITAYVDSVIDSSRYFVLRLKDPKSSRSTNIGIGFRERDVAFDFKNCLNEYVRYIDRMAKADEMKAVVDKVGGGDEDGGGDFAQNLLGDLTIKDGIKIHVKSKFKKSDSSSSVGKTGFNVGLAPPPSGGTSVFTILAPPPATSSIVDNSKVPNTDEFDAEFGDFEEA